MIEREREREREREENEGEGRKRASDEVRLSIAKDPTCHRWILHLGLQGTVPMMEEDLRSRGRRPETGRESRDGEWKGRERRERRKRRKEGSEEKREENERGRPHVSMESRGGWRDGWSEGGERVKEGEAGPTVEQLTFFSFLSSPSTARYFHLDLASLVLTGKEINQLKSTSESWNCTEER